MFYFVTMCFAPLDVGRYPWRFAAVLPRSTSVGPHKCKPLVTWALACIVLSSLPITVQAQDAAEVAVKTAAQRWFVGAYYRHAWVPQLMLKPFFERAAGINNHGFGIVASHVADDGFTAELGAGYMPYYFKGAFNPNAAPIEDTEYVQSELKLLHLTSSLLWPITLSQRWRVEIGLGLDLGIVSGRLSRTEAYPKNGAFHPCEGPLQPAVSRTVDNEPIAYCEQAFNDNDEAIETSGATRYGAHYRDRETRVPPVMLIPMLPHVALRFAATEDIALKLEAAFGLAQFWLGASLHLGLSPLTAHPQPASLPPGASHPSPPPGRVIGKIMNRATRQPIAHASIKSTSMFSALQSDDTGLFVFENLEPGPLHLQVTHPDYPKGTCDTAIPPEGGDVHLHCFLHAPSQLGAISGHARDRRGFPVQAAIELAGPIAARLSSDDTGGFALPQAPAGVYEVRAEAPGYVTQRAQVQLEPQATAVVDLVLPSAQPALVRREAGSLLLRSPITFDPGGSELSADSDRVLRDMAELLLRQRDITLLEIQSHTDNQAERSQNMALSQVRAEAVRARLIEYGVAKERMRARGYGPDQPLVPHDDPDHRARNWRMQFIIEQVTPQASTEGTSP